MNHDPFYRKIEEGLAGRLDHDLFEQCAVDLLRRVYPGLVPIRGGDDAGMDGAIADRKGRPFLLIVTTSDNTTSNLSHNLNTYIQEGGKRREAVFATSRILTARRRANLDGAASKLGFTLVQIHDGVDFADRLYRDSKWCKDLLGLSGDPSPLSVVPLSERPLLNISLIGRDEDTAWLRETNGDRLLVGQPGSGKTFLLRQLAKEGWGLFAISRDRGEIAAGIRDQEPTMLIVDDVSPDDTILTDLKQLREAIHADFAIAATCWPRDKERIMEILQLAENHVHTLGLLIRPEIAKVIDGTGLRCGIPLMNDLVAQAEGRPGLAATLAHILLQGGWDEVVSGDRVRMSLLGKLAGEVLPVLALFSLGGNGGLQQQTVAKVLGIPMLQLWGMLRDCKAAGVLFDCQNESISVRPPVLRCALIREVFFKDGESLPIMPIVQQIGEHAMDVGALIEARTRGAQVPDDLIRPRLDSGWQSYWREYAWLGKRETEWVLANHPEKVTEIVGPALRYVPDRSIPLLLQEAVGDQRALHAYPEAPLHLIQDWVNSAVPGSGEVIARRKCLLQAVRLWIEAGKEVETALRACEFVMSLRYHKMDALDVKDSVRLTSGAVTLQESQAIRLFWPNILGFYQRTGSCHWEPLRAIVEDWAYPIKSQVSLTLEYYQEVKLFAGEMLLDLLKIAEGHLDIYHWAQQIAEDLHLEIEIPIDQDFATLYPYEPYRRQDWGAVGKEQELAVRNLAAQWSQGDAAWVAGRLVYIEDVAAKMQRRWPRLSPMLCRFIGELTNQPLTWSRAMMAAHVTGDMINPFLRRAVDLGQDGWQKQVAACFAEEEYVGSMLDLVLTLPAPPEHLVDLALSHATGYAGSIIIWCLRREVREDIVEKLLRHPDPQVAEAAAHGEWAAEPKGHIRKSLAESWHRVVVNSPSGFWLGEVFEQNPVLALEWLQNHLTQFSYFLSKTEEDTVNSAIRSLDSGARITLLHDIPPDFECLPVISALVGDDFSVYQELLNNQSLAAFHLVPLSGTPDDLWIGKAQMALGKYSPEQIIMAMCSPLGVHVFWGNESDQWKERLQALDKLANHPDERIRELGRVGKAYTQRRYEFHLARERDEAVYGRSYDR